MSAPSTYTDTNETGCCAVPNVADWDRVTVEFDAQPFIRRHTRSVMHVPLDMSRVMTGLDTTARSAGVTMPPDRAMVLSRELSAWRAEQLYAVTAPVAGADNVTLDGRFASAAFEGPYGQSAAWVAEARDFARTQGEPGEETYVFYTTCPRCAKHYGRNDVIVLVPVT
jgi:hypothetical protein